MYPAHDEQFEEFNITKVEPQSDGGWRVDRADGWSFFVPADSKIAPEVGMPIRFYGKGIGFTVRGLFIAGIRVYYRTEEEERDHHEIETYGADVTDWLRRWDEGKTCWSIEMGGLGPGYEQCIHITMAEILRFMLEKKYDVDGLQRMQK
jgi:hypothetical protein